MEQYNENLEYSAVVQVLKNIGLKHPENLETAGNRLYRHTAGHGTVREFRVYTKKEYFDMSRKGFIGKDQRLHKALTQYILERVVSRNGTPVENKASFYTLDPEYKKYNGQSFEILRCSDNGVCREIKLECGDIIVAFRDETDGFIQDHEYDPVRIPVNWEMSGYVDFRCESIEEALEKYWEQKELLPLPQGTYLEDSFQLSTEDIATIAMYNHSFRNPKRIRRMEE